MNIPATFQKTKGIITLLESQLSFSDNKPILVLPYDMIKAQFVNVPKPNGKIILKLELHDNNVSFNFASSEQREVVKNWISQRMQLSRVEIQARQDLLSKDETLCKNHKNWVNKGYIKENEFWETLSTKLKDQEWFNNQTKGPSSLLLSDLKPSGSEGGQHDLKYTLNPEIIHSIFSTYPAVLRAYQENVPLKLTEREFWTKYFSSQYYYRKKMGLTTGTKISGDIFDMYADLDDQDLLISPENLVYTPCNNLLDLSSTNQDHLSSGNRLDVTMRHGSVKESLGLIRRFNRHSEMVLKAIKERDIPPEMDKIYENETEMSDLKVEKPLDGINLSIKDPSSYYPGDKRPHSEIEPEGDSLQELQKDLMKWDVSSLSCLELADLLDSETPKKLDLLIRTQNQKNKSSELDHLVPFISGINELLRHSWALYHLKLDDSTKLSGILKAMDQLCHDNRQFASMYPKVFKSVQDRIEKSQKRNII